MLSFTDLLNAPLSSPPRSPPHSPLPPSTPQHSRRGREYAADESSSESEPDSDSDSNRPPSPTPQPRPRKQLSRDQRRDIQLLRRQGLTQVQTAERLGLTVRAVQYTDQTGCATPKKRSGRPPKLGSAEVEELIEYVTASEENRQKSYHELAAEFQEYWPHLDVGFQSIKYALRSAGFSRRKALKKPRIDADCAEKRLRFALEHRHWTEEQWMQVLWTDETWVGAGLHKRVYVTVRKGEQLNPDCIMTAYRHKVAWMFWGSFNGTTKGPHLFWERADWGTITGQTYNERIVPLIHGWLTMNPDLLFMQDNARSHTAQVVKDEMAWRGIFPIEWPPNSPDMNPIEKLWNKMKDWIQARYPKQENSYDKLRKIVRDAWDAITEEDLLELIREMPARMQAVIDAEGYHTKY